ncbi:MAG: hypothetical protein QOH01_3152 [Verrucomicrobiota bacterium]|jgi:hypothetical protein
MLETSSVALATINALNLPEILASGCLMNYHGRRLLLTVAHAAEEPTPLALSLGWEPSIRRMKLWKLGGLNFLVRGQLGTGSTALDQMTVMDVDFAYVEVPSHLEPRLEKIDPHTGNITNSRACTVWSATAIAEPEPRACYGFAGHTKPKWEEHPLITKDVKLCSTELRVCFPLSFVKRHDDLLAFRLPVEHPGHDYFRGCSGAPIVDVDGHVVALVCSGDVASSTIFGISLRHYQAALDVHTGRIS